MLQFAMGQGPCMLGLCLSVYVDFVFTIIKEVLEIMSLDSFW